MDISSFRYRESVRDEDGSYADSESRSVSEPEWEWFREGDESYMDEETLVVRRWFRFEVEARGGRAELDETGDEVREMEESLSRTWWWEC